MDLRVHCLSFAVENMESCASTLELAYTNISAKMCAIQAHRKLTGEDRCCEKGGKLLVRGVKEVNAEAALHLALEDTKAVFARLSTSPLSESQQHPVVRQRADSVSQPPAKINLPSPLDGRNLYSLHQAMDVISSSSASF